MNDSVGKHLLLSLIEYICTFLGPTVLVMLLYQLFEPSAFRDGQFILVFILSLPVGVILTVGLFLSNVAKKRNRKGKWPLLLAGAVVIALSVGLAFFSASTRGLTAGEFMSTAISPWCMSPLLFGVGFMLAGGVLQQNRKN